MDCQRVEIGGAEVWRKGRDRFRIAVVSRAGERLWSLDAGCCKAKQARMTNNETVGAKDQK
jgi:hypothetical protein